MKTSFWTKLLDLINPRLCVVCGQRLSANESFLCCVCHLHLPLTHFELQPIDNPMARLMWGRFVIERACALYYYEPKSEMAEIVYSLKYRNRPELGRLIGQVMAQRLQPKGFFEGIDALVPVPLSKQRQRERGYNQAEELARGLSDATGLPIFNKVVKRTAFATSQTHLNANERQENVEHVFQLIDAQQIAHKHLLVIDDVITTGSTITACAHELQQAPDVKISVLTLGFSKS